MSFSYLIWSSKQYLYYLFTFWLHPVHEILIQQLSRIHFRDNLTCHQTEGENIPARRHGVLLENLGHRQSAIESIDNRLNVRQVARSQQANQSFIAHVRDLQPEAFIQQALCALQISVKFNGWVVNVLKALKIIDNDD